MRRAAPGRAHWYAQAAALLGLLVFAAVMRYAAPLRLNTVIALVVACIPSVLWLVFFWAVDRRELEPTEYVVEIFLLGALLAQAVVGPLTRDVFQVPRWLDDTFATRVLGSILVIGAIQTFVNYAAVRYTVFGTPAMSSVMDGVVYGTAAGLGMATVFNIAFVLDAGGFPTTIAALHVVVTALAQAALGMAVGYFLGRAKVDQSHSHLLLGVGLVAALNGIFNMLLNTVSQVGLTQRPWNGLLLALALAIGVSVAVYVTAERPQNLAPA